MAFNFPGIPQAPSGVGQALTQPQVPAAGIAPTDPKQLNLWQRFQERLKQDPNLQMALLTTGLNLLRTPQPGQSGFDVFADAATTGVGTLDQLRQRDKSAARQVTQDQLAERRVGAAEQGVAISGQNAETNRQRVLQSNEQFKTQMELARDKLAEDKRQFNERDKAGVNSPITGGERLVNAGIEALVTANPDVYPDNAEGRAKARLRMQGMEGTQDPLGQARIIAGLVGDMQENNVFMPKNQQLSNEEILQRALETFSIITGDLSQPAEAGDPLEGASIAHPVNGAGKVVKVGEDKYVVEFAGGSTGELTKTQIEALVGASQ